MSAPSFSSFPPSFSSFPDLEASGSGKDSEVTVSPVERNREKGKKKDRSSSSKKQSHSRKNDHKPDDRHRPRHSKEHRPLLDDDQRTGSTPSEPLNHLFYSDRKGDHKNIQYGSLHGGDVAKYRLVGGGRNILGLPNALVALRRAGKGVEIGIKSRAKMSSLTDSGARALLSRPPSRRISANSQVGKYQEIDGFIRLPSRRGIDIRNAEESYRSITKGHDHDDSDSNSASENEEEFESEEENDLPVLTAHQETLKRLDLELNAKPEDVDTWLSLLNQTLSTIPPTSKNATKSRNEITLSILSRALSAAPQNSTNKVLRLAFLKAGEDIWHESKLRSEWEDALKLGGIEIWMEWLEWKIKTATHGINAVVQSAVRALNSFRDDIESELAKIRIFWRVATAIRNAGYSERAMAMFQAEAELIFCVHEKLSVMNFQEQMNELEEFWDSEEARIGDEYAKGWAIWYSAKEGQHERPRFRDPQISPISDLDPYRQWAYHEIEADRKMLLPLRSDSDASDPYSIVMFADIRAMMVSIKSRRAKCAFRLAWLSFLGLHLPGLSLAPTCKEDWDDRWNLGHLTSASYLNVIFPSDAGKNKLLNDAIAGVVIGREREYVTPFGPVQCWNNDVVGPFDIASIDPGKSPNKCIWTSIDIQNIDENIIRRLFSSHILKLGEDDVNWNTLALAFEAAINPKSAVQLSKTFLSSYPHSLVLWNAHAQLERMRGRLGNARKVYQTVLVANRQGEAQPQASLLWWNWAEMEWLTGDEKTALNVVLKSAGVEGVHSGITILRAKRSLDDAVKNMGPSTQWKEKESWIRLRALLELLTESEPIDVLDIFDKHILADYGGSSNESLTTASLLFLYYHGFILKKTTPPSILRDRAHRAFEEYPNNSIILGVVLEAERGQGVWGRVRSMLGGTDGKTKDVARQLEEVWIAGWEKGRWLREVERTRSGLIVAVEHQRTKASSTLWRIYLEFEIRLGDFQRAKSLLFRAIGECPLAKELYLLAFGPLRSVFHIHELNGLADTMVERGIRLHQGLDEAVADMNIVDEGGRESVTDYESGDEIEENARELRRLMPY